MTEQLQLAEPIRTDAEPIATASPVLDELNQVVEVTIIRPGQARVAVNGSPVTYTEEALRQSLPMWEGAACFCDHFNKSVRNIAGVFFAPWYDGGVKAKLRFIDTPLYRMVTRIVSDREAGLAVPDVGLSADIAVNGESTEDGLTVTEITRVVSADIVFSPAAGGSFDRVLNSVMHELGIAADQNESGTVSGRTSDAGEASTGRLVPEKRVRDLQSTADRLRNQVRDQEAAIQELRGNLSEAVNRYRDALLKQHPEIPADMLEGDTVAALDASLEQARAVVDNVKRHLAERVPAGAPQRTGPDISSMSPGEKITYGLRQRGFGK
ncbi:MAG: hypothetical protein DRI39_09325 [Chloroflexi bacterium]|nr:MAG: hypothetical protein DRI39_09325 [Chloroflexota bacterium]RLC93877.1 MAG: hypothetical protein DRI40_08200 [Chloroflexota bacterium]